MKFLDSKTVVIGNEFAVTEKQTETVNPVAAVAPSVDYSFLQTSPSSTATHHHHDKKNGKHFNKRPKFKFRNSLAASALVLLVIGVVGIKVGAHYYEAHELKSFKPVAAISPSAVIGKVFGGNMAVYSDQLDSTLQSIINQPAKVTIGDQSTVFNSDAVKGWLSIVPSPDKSTDIIHVNQSAVVSAIVAAANQFTSSPVDQVQAIINGNAETAVNGQNGTAIGDPSDIQSQAQAAAANLLNAKGFNVTGTLTTLAFKNLTPADFPKIIIVNTSSKVLYAYQNGQLANTFLVSAGKPSTPTPIGEFHIWDKLTSQTMTGPGYVQPDVPYINYFDHSGDAIHGVYWRPASVFGNVNTSHGCVGLPIDEAEWVYDWAPIGTPVITTLD